jgi:hypothetical protein
VSTTDPHTTEHRGRAFGPDAAAILSTEHWSLLTARTLLINEGQQRTTVFLTTLSAATVAIALLADATGFGRRALTFALVILPIVLFIGVTTYGRLIQINRDEKQTMLAMNRLRNAYLTMRPELRPYFTASPYDDERGFATSYSLVEPTTARSSPFFLVTTPTVVGTVNAAVAGTLAVLAVLAVTTPPPAVLTIVGAAVFGSVWAGLFALQRRTLEPLRVVPRFPAPPPARRQSPEEVSGGGGEDDPLDGSAGRV